MVDGRLVSGDGSYSSVVDDAIWLLCTNVPWRRQLWLQRTVSQLLSTATSNTAYYKAVMRFVSLH